MSDRERIDVDILIVGGGPAGMSAAVRIAQLQQTDGRTPLVVAVLDKAPEPGAHVLSGAVLDHSVLAELIPDFAERGAPVSCPVVHDAVYLLTSRRRWRLPFTPPPLMNAGHHVVSLQALVKWLAGIAEAGGIDVINGVAASEVLYEGTAVAGIRTRDLGLDRQRRPAANFQPGVDVRAKVTIFCDGVRGNLTKTLIRDRGLDRRRSPQLYAIGLKELWELPAGRIDGGEVVHTLGYPVPLRDFGGGFLYGMPGGLTSVGLVVGLDYRDPWFDPFEAFQAFKRHPFIAELLEGGRCLRYGAKALPEGGWHAIPKVYMDGALVAGDAAGFLNTMRLKGIHLAMKTGMLAAEAAVAAVRSGETSEQALARYSHTIDRSLVRHELYPARNVRQAFQRGLVPGLAFAGWSLVSGGWWFRDPLPARAGPERLSELSRESGTERRSPPARPDRRLTFDRATSVHRSGTRHREDQPSHLLVHDTDICRTRCVAEYGNPCTRFCPASVYEMIDDGQGGRRLHVNASNCVHCRTCDIMDPYQIIDWVPPEGGGGPRYVLM